jgi:hypothetical protein
MDKTWVEKRYPRKASRESGGREMKGRAWADIQVLVRGPGRVVQAPINKSKYQCMITNRAFRSE